jgi:hypothetical protein
MGDNEAFISLKEVLLNIFNQSCKGWVYCVTSSPALLLAADKGAGRMGGKPEEHNGEAIWEMSVDICDYVTKALEE